MKRINKKFNHFLISWKENSKLVFNHNFGEVIFFINTKKRLEIKDFLNKQLSKISQIKIISISFFKSKNINLICYKSAEELNFFTRTCLSLLVENLIWLKFEIDINIKMVDFNIANLNAKKFDIKYVKKNIRDVLKTENDFLIPSYPKKIRKEINELLIKYKKIKAKTVGDLGVKKIKLTYKK